MCPLVNRHRFFLAVEFLVKLVHKLNHAPFDEAFRLSDIRHGVYMRNRPFEDCMFPSTLCGHEIWIHNAVELMSQRLQVVGLERWSFNLARAFEHKDPVITYFGKW